jgi:RimJ/RimL family protein N-acetyltransferase
MDLTKISRNLDTVDLNLRPLVIEDAQGMFQMLSDPECMKYWSSPPLSTIDDAARLLQQDLDSDARGDSVCWAINRKNQSNLIGKCILFNFSQANRRAEIGFILKRKYWRQGLTQQAVEAVIDFAFKILKLHRIEADVDPGNQGSLGLLEKLDFKREGLLPERWYVHGEWQDSVVLGLIGPD